jgi:hypothetical protein
MIIKTFGSENLVSFTSCLTGEYAGMTNTGAIWYGHTNLGLEPILLRKQQPLNFISYNIYWNTKAELLRVIWNGDKDIPQMQQVIIADYRTKKNAVMNSVPSSICPFTSYVLEISANSSVFRSTSFSTMELPLSLYFDFTTTWQFTLHLFVAEAVPVFFDFDDIFFYFIGAKQSNQVKYKVTSDERNSRISCEFTVGGMINETQDNHFDFMQVTPLRILPFGSQSNNCLKENNNAIMMKDPVNSFDSTVVRSHSIFPVIPINVYNGCPPKYNLIMDITMDPESKLFLYDFSKEGCNPIYDIPCFYYGNSFTPKLFIRDKVEQDKLIPYYESYNVRIIGGGPTHDNIQIYNSEVRNN